jgi:hypothetical protein
MTTHLSPEDLVEVLEEVLFRSEPTRCAAIEDRARAAEIVATDRNDRMMEVFFALLNSPQTFPLRKAWAPVLAKLCLPSIEELIFSSSLGTSEAVSLRAQADPEVVQSTLERADELEAAQRYEDYIKRWGRRSP